MTDDEVLIAFVGQTRLARGSRAEILRALHSLPTQQHAATCVFDAQTGRIVDFDRRNPEDAPVSRPRGRPKLGVVAREVTLLPRHWDWLAEQPGGASVALRRLVDAARRTGDGAMERRRSQDAAYRFMTALAGDFPNYEEAIRALFAGDADRFTGQIAAWPDDIRDEAQRMAAPGFARTG